MFSLEYFFYLVPHLATKRTYGVNIKIEAISWPDPDFTISVLHSFRANFSAAGARRRDARASQYWMMDHFGIHLHFRPWKGRGRGPHRVPHRVGGAGD